MRSSRNTGSIPMGTACLWSDPSQWRRGRLGLQFTSFLMCTFVSFVVDEVQMLTTKDTEVHKGAPYQSGTRKGLDARSPTSQFDQRFPRQRFLKRYTRRRTGGET